MNPKCVPMFHVPDVRVTAEWYQGIGFRIVHTAGDGGAGLSFAMVSFGGSEVMFSSGGAASAARRREVDLYVYTEDVDGLHARLQGRVDVVEGPHDTFYGMREVIIRDVNRFWITFGEPSAASQLLQGLATGDVDAVRTSLRRPGCDADLLSVALVKARHAPNPNAAVVRVLEEGGAVMPPLVAIETLRAHEGAYATPDGSTVRVVLCDGLLRAFTDDGFGAHLLPLDANTYRPIEFGTATVTFRIADGRTTAMTLTHGAHQTLHLRV